MYLNNIIEFFTFSVKKLLISTGIFIVAVPFINTGIVMPCLLPPCPEVSATILTWIWRQYDFLKVDWIAFLVGMILSYILASIISYFNRKDILLSVLVITLQFGCVFLAQEIIAGNNAREDLLAICLMIALGLGEYWFVGKRKRVLVFTFVLPLLLIRGLIFY